MGYPILAGATAVLEFSMVLKSDGSPAPGLAPVVQVKKLGGAWFNPTGAPVVNDRGHGLYDFTCAAADLDTLGPFWVRATEAGGTAQEAQEQFKVVGYDESKAWPDAAHYTNARGDLLSNLDESIIAAVAALVAAINTRAAPGAGMGLTAGERTALANAILDLADAIETGITLRQALQQIGSSVAGDSDGAAVGASTMHFKDIGPATKNRITASVDGAGNRTLIVRDLT